MPTIEGADLFVTLPSSADDAEVLASHDFSTYDGYLDDLPVLYLDQQGARGTQLMKLRPPRTDVGTSTFEQRPNFGDFFAEGDFSHGSLQRYFHHDPRDPAKYLRSEGFDIRLPGKLTHLNTLTEITVGAKTGLPHRALVQALGVIYTVMDDTPDGAFYSDGAFPGTWSDIATTWGGDAVDITAAGDVVYMAASAGGIWSYTDGGVAWVHYVTDPVTVVCWAKDRLFAADGASIYEVTGAGSLPLLPTPLETLPDGWVFTDICEGGYFLYAVAQNPELGLSAVYTYSIETSTGNMIPKAHTPFPKGDIVRTGIATQGRVFIGGGRQNSSGGLDAVLYEAAPTTSTYLGFTGDLQLSLIAFGDSAGANDASVRSFETTSEAVVFGWNSAERTGTGIFHLARNAFANHLKVYDSFVKLNAVLQYQGRFLIATETGLYYEVLDSPVASATLVSSVADFNTSGTKTWDLFELFHDPLTLGQSVLMEFTRVDPDYDAWETALDSAMLGASGAQARVEDVRCRTLAVRLTSTAGILGEPITRSYSVRSNPTPVSVAETEWEMVRTVRVLHRDRKDSGGSGIIQDTRGVRSRLQDMAFRWVTLYEPGITWTAWVENVSETSPGDSRAAETAGTPENEAYYIQLQMVGRRAA